jgi:hypothetical protein
VVYNIKSQESRLIELTPSEGWGGAGLLGVTIRLDNYAGAEDRLIRVLEVENKSPAHVAGLVPYKDYLLGTTTATLDSTETLASLLKSHQDLVVELYVYNSDTDVVRVVALLPTLGWGGPGLLGAAVGTGYLHRLPSSTRHTEGVSVERKVRYVGVDGTASSSYSGKERREHPIRTAIPALGAAASDHGTMLELEPQLEMEREESSCDDASAAEMSSVALSLESESVGRGAADATPRSSSISARGAVVVETVMNEPEDEVEEKERTIDQQEGNGTRQSDPSSRPTSSWMEPVTEQERESSSSGRRASEEAADGAVEMDRDMSEWRNHPDPPPPVQRRVAEEISAVAAATTRLMPEPPLSPSLPTTAATATAAEAPSAKAASAAAMGFLPPPPKMHYSAST